MRHNYGPDDLPHADEQIKARDEIHKAITTVLIEQPFSSIRDMKRSNRSGKILASIYEE
jgi:hypothetical protein